jgi:hypothetical protein
VPTATTILRMEGSGSMMNKRTFIIKLADRIIIALIIILGISIILILI